MQFHPRTKFDVPDVRSYLQNVVSVNQLIIIIIVIIIATCQHFLCRSYYYSHYYIIIIISRTTKTCELDRYYTIKIIWILSPRVDILLSLHIYYIIYFIIISIFIITIIIFFCRKTEWKKKHKLFYILSVQVDNGGGVQLREKIPNSWVYNI